MRFGLPESQAVTGGVIGQITASGLTVEARVVLSAARPGLGTLAIVSRAVGGQYEWVLRTNTLGLPQFEVWTPAGATAGQFAAVDAIMGRPTHLAVTVSGLGSAVTAILYADGLPVASATLNISAYVSTGQQVRIGTRADQSSSWEGSITDVRLWNYARAPEQIRQGLLNGITGQEPGLSAWYPLLADALDYGPSGLHGTIVGSPVRQQALLR